MVDFDVRRICRTKDRMDQILELNDNSLLGLFRICADSQAIMYFHSLPATDLAGRWEYFLVSSMQIIVIIEIYISSYEAL